MKVESRLNHNEYLCLQVRRNFINLTKDFLIVLEEFRDENLISSEYYAKLRSRLLGRANDRIRDLEETVNSLDIEIKKS